MQSKAASIPTYLNGLPPTEREVITQLDRIVRSEIPSAVGSMKYGMPTYQVGDRMIACNVQKNHFSFYADPQILNSFRSELRSLSVGKSCIRFRKLDPALLATLRKIVAAYQDA